MEGNARGKRKIIQSKNEPNKSKKKEKKKMKIMITGLAIEQKTFLL
jgi:polysaccharide deacetylase 2 family uncharacterized protein YibQ